MREEIIKNNRKTKQYTKWETDNGQEKRVGLAWKRI